MPANRGLNVLTIEAAVCPDRVGIENATELEVTRPDWAPFNREDSKSDPEGKSMVTTMFDAARAEVFVRPVVNTSWPNKVANWKAAF